MERIERKRELIRRGEAEEIARFAALREIAHPGDEVYCEREVKLREDGTPYAGADLWFGLSLL